MDRVTKNSCTAAKFVRVCVVLLVPVAVFVVAARYRFVDGDEGFYLYAAKLLTMGQKPYLDFFHPQTPLLIQIYSLWFCLTDANWLSARALSLIIAVSIGAALYLRAARAMRHGFMALAVVALFSLHGLVFSWFVVAKTYALSALLLLWAVMAFVTVYERSVIPKLGVFLAGCLVGLTVQTRLMLIGVAPVFCLALARLDLRPRERVALLWLFLTGCVLGVLPLFYFMYSDFGSFWFSNLGYHSLRSEGGLVGEFHQKGKVLADLFGRRSPGAGVFGLQNAVILTFLVMMTRRPMSSPAKFVAALIGVLGLVSLAPTPTFVQYFSVLLPLVFLLIIECIHTGAFAGVSRAKKRAVALLIVLYVLMFPLELYRNTVSGRNVPGVDAALQWKIESIARVSDWLNDHASDHERIVSSWPGYLLGARALAIENTENHFSWQVAERLSDEHARRFHVMRHAELREIIRKKDCRYFVFNLWTHKREELEDLLEDSGYTVRFSLGTIRIYGP